MPSEGRRQEGHIELIVSESYTGPMVMVAQGSKFTNKYARRVSGQTLLWLSIECSPSFILYFPLWLQGLWLRCIIAALDAKLFIYYANLPSYSVFARIP